MINSKQDEISADDREGQRPNVAVMEFLYHWDYFITTVEVLKHLANVFLIVGENFKTNLERNYRFSVKDFKHFIVRDLNWPQIDAYIVKNRISKIFIPTVQGFEFTYAFSHFNPPVPFYFTIHNFDLWLGRRTLIPNGDGGLIAEINKVYTLMCRGIIQRSGGIITIDENLRDHVTPMLNGKDVYVMPWKTNTELTASLHQNGSEKNEIVFTVPASVDCARRNYGVVLETFKELSRNHQNIKLVLLGRPVGGHGQEVLKQSQRINHNAGRQVIEYFNDFVHQNIYDKCIQKSHYFILPLEHLDIIGKYKASAAMYDAMLSGRPILVPQKMNFSQDFVSRYGEGFIVYDDLKDTIEEILAMPAAEIPACTDAAVSNANTFFIKNQVETAGRKFFNQEAV